MNDIPDWAGKRACELLNEEGPAYPYDWPNDGMSVCVRTVAKLVMQHETAPVDPDEEAVKRIIGAYWGFSLHPVSWCAKGLARAVSQYKQERSK